MCVCSHNAPEYANVLVDQICVTFKWLLDLCALLCPPCSFHQNGGVVWTKGDINISGGMFTENTTPESGGVFFGSEESSITLDGGMFEKNMAEDGAVASVSDGSTLRVENGVFTGNVAEGQGGAFSVIGGGDIQASRQTKERTCWAFLSMSGYRTCTM